MQYLQHEFHISEISAICLGRMQYLWEFHISEISAICLGRTPRYLWEFHISEISAICLCVVRIDSR